MQILTSIWLKAKKKRLSRNLSHQNHTKTSPITTKSLQTKVQPLKKKGGKY